MVVITITITIITVTIILIPRAGAEVNPRRLKDGWTPLFLATVFGHTAQVKFVSSYLYLCICVFVLYQLCGHHISPSTKRAPDELTIFITIATKMTFSRALLAAGADVLLADNIGWTPEDWAARYHSCLVISLFCYGRIKNHILQ